jgi:hypothetical protein
MRGNSQFFHKRRHHFSVKCSALWKSLDFQEIAASLTQKILSGMSGSKLSAGLA